MNGTEAIQRFESYQKEKGLTQQEALKEIGIHASSLTRWKQNPDSKLSAKIEKRILSGSSQSALVDYAKKEIQEVNPLPPEPSKDSEPDIPDMKVKKDSEVIQYHRDEKGRSFNSAMHVVDENENPILKNGMFVIKPKQLTIDKQDEIRKEQEKENEEKRIIEEAEQKVFQEELRNVQSSKELNLKAESVATISSFVFFKGGSAFFGKRFEPTKEEKTEISEALEKYWRLKGAPDIPPVVELATVLGMYTAKKIASSPAEPNTLFSKMKNWFRNRKKKKFQEGLNNVQNEIREGMKNDRPESNTKTESTDPFSIQGGFPAGEVP